MTFNPVDNLDYLIPKSWTVREKITTAWARLNINADIGEVGVRGNIGVQMQHTDQSSDSRYWDSSQSVKTTCSRTRTTAPTTIGCRA